MSDRSNMAEEGILRGAERWTDADADLWERWRKSLSPGQRNDALLPLQAALSGLVAFRHLEGHPVIPVTDFRPHLYSVRVAYAWAMELVAQLRDEHAPEQRFRSLDEPLGEPESSLLALERSLADALRLSELLLELPVIDARAFRSSCDLFLRDLARNPFFRPLDPLEFLNMADLVRPESLTPRLDSGKGEAADMMTLVAFVTLLRGHRFLGIADRQLCEEDGLHRTHIVVAAVRRELKALTRFLLVEGVEAFAEEPEGSLPASVEAIAMAIHAKAQSALEGALPELESGRGYARLAEAMQKGIREARTTLKAAAKELRDLACPVRTEGKSQCVQKSFHHDVWAFRFILRAFAAKASAASVGEDAWRLDFVGEFVSHFRSFEPRVVRGSDYPREAQLTRAVRALTHEAIDSTKLDLAARECALFLDHLEQALAEMPQSLLESFDKRGAAAELRRYLMAAKARTTAARAAAAAFGLIDAGRPHPS